MSMFYDEPTTDASYIWSHGVFPDPEQRYDPNLSGAKQLLFSRLSAHYKSWTAQDKLDVFARDVFHELLGVLAANYLFGNASGELWVSHAMAQDQMLDFTEVGLAYLRPHDSGNGAFVIREPLALELAVHLGNELDQRPAATEAWRLLLDLQLQGTGATVSKVRVRSYVRTYSPERGCSRATR